MKIIQAFLLVLALTFAQLALAKPVWCVSGSEQDADHPLSRTSLAYIDQSELQLVAKLRLISDAFEAEVARIKPGTGFQGDDERDLALFRGVMTRVTNTYIAENIIEGVRLSAGRLQTEGLTTVTCFPIAGTVDTPGPVLKNIYYAAYAAEKIAATFLGGIPPVTPNAINQRIKEYDAWILSDQSLAQWPWEMYINGKRISDNFNKPPPLTQIIAMRPSAGLNLSFANQEEADAVPAFAIEPIGYIKYSDHTYQKHLGVSLLVTLGTENGAGYGVAVRWNGYWAGYAVHSGDNADAVYVGVDLYNYLKSDQSKMDAKKAFVARLSDALNKNSAP